MINSLSAEIIREYSPLNDNNIVSPFCLNFLSLFVNHSYIRMETNDLSSPHLPILDCLKRVEEHDDIERQIIMDHKAHKKFHGNSQRNNDPYR